MIDYNEFIKKRDQLNAWVKENYRGITKAAFFKTKMNKDYYEYFVIDELYYEVAIEDIPIKLEPHFRLDGFEQSNGAGKGSI